MSANKKCTNHALPTIYKRNLCNYESSDANMIMSISVYYCGGIASKENNGKFIERVAIGPVYRKNRTCVSISECPIQRFVPHDKLMRYIKSIPVGNIYSVYDTLCDDLDEVLR